MEPLKTTKLPSLTALAIAVALSLVLAACAADDADDTGAQVNTTAETPSDEATDDATPAEAATDDSADDADDDPAAADDAGAEDAGSDEMTDMDGDGEDMDDDDMAGDDMPMEHAHEAIVVDAWDAIPAVDAEAFIDPKAGVNLQISFENWTMAPEHASGDAVEGEGHYHVYVDGEKVARQYTEWLYLAMEPGEHEIEVELSANDHSTLELDGERIFTTLTVEVPEAQMSHSHSADDVFEATDPIPGVSLEVFEDPKAGYNVHVTTADYTFRPDLASTADTTSGEGHAHLYVNDTKITRMYGDWFHYNGPIMEGDNEFRVELSANNHHVYAADGQPIEAIVTVVADEATGEATGMDMSDHDDESQDGDHHDEG